MVLSGAYFILMADFLQQKQRFTQAFSGGAAKVLRTADAQERSAIDHPLIFQLVILSQEDSDDVHPFPRSFLTWEQVSRMAASPT